MQKIVIFICTFTLLMVSEVYTQTFWGKINFPSNDTLYSIFVDNQNNLYIGTRYEGIYKSSDNSKSWEQINNGFGRLRVPNIISNSKNDLIAISWTDGIYFSSDFGNSWVQKNEGLPSKFVGMKLAIDTSDNLYLGTKNGFFISTNNKDSWNDITYGNELSYNDIDRIAITKNKDIFIIPSGGGIYRLSSGEESWKLLDFKLSRVFVLTSIISNTNDQIVIASGDSGIVHSNDYGDSFIKSSDTSINHWIGYLQVNSDNHLFGIFVNHKVYRSINNGESWDPLDSEDDSTGIYKLCVSPDGFLYGLTLDNGLYRSKEPLEIFRINTTLSPDTIPIVDYLDTLSLKLLIKDEKYENILSGANLNVIDSLSGQELLLQSDSLGYCFYETIVPESIDTGFYKITFINSKFAYRNDTSYMQVHVMHEEVSVRDFDFITNINIQPNPSDGEFNIHYNLLRPDYLRFSIYDNIGKEIFNSKPLYHDIGEYDIQFDILNSHPSGFYYLKFNVGNVVSTIPVMIMK